ncbi:MAG: hypothetical protein ACXAEU_23955 [Candidatus Hodarchaeales archaeon]|jgi:hypothetical protein
MMNSFRPRYYMSGAMQLDDHLVMMLMTYPVILFLTVIGGTVALILSEVVLPLYLLY